MTKTNYTKVEVALDEGLRKITVSKLLDDADTAAGKESAVVAEHKASAQRQLLIALQHELKLLHKQMPEAYSKAHMAPAKLKSLLAHPEKLTPQNWEEVKKAKMECDAMREALAKKSSPSANEDLVSKERRKHINKRFNVNEKWLPLK